MGLKEFLCVVEKKCCFSDSSWTGKHSSSGERLPMSDKWTEPGWKRGNTSFHGNFKFCNTVDSHVRMIEAKCS